MKNSTVLLLFMTFLFTFCKSDKGGEGSESVNSESHMEKIVPINDAHRLVIEMVNAVGGRKMLYDLKDVEYSYSYRDLRSGKEDITTERYLFDGERSWAEYEKRELFAPHLEGKIIQNYDGEGTSVSLNGMEIEDEEIVKRADFNRKTNYYWLVMMYKLLDEGITYEEMADQMVNGINYHRVRIGYEDGVGDVQDTYLLYIHPETKLVDQFLFTVLDFGREEPLLMEVEYEDIPGVKIDDPSQVPGRELGRCA